jgi:uncharacterized protein YgiM (DUF1202 family)
MKRLAVLLFPLLLLSAACAKEAPAVTETTDTREPVAIRYVGAPELPVRTQANDTAEVVATYQNGEAISVLAEKGEWAEIRLGGGSGWVRAADLTTAEGKQASEDNPTPKFKVMPLPVSAPSARGEIYIEADVNSEGEVLTVRMITNTTGSNALAAQNSAALMKARFYPIMQDGEKKPFKYYHRVTY